MKIKRRDFFEKGLVAGAAAASVSCQKTADSAPLKRNKALMYPGTQAFRDSDAELEFLVRHGITNKVGYPAISPKSRVYQLEDMEKLIEQNDKHGVRVDMVPLPIDQMNAEGGQAPDYMLCTCERGDREIDLICDMIRTTAKAGIPAIKYYLCESPNQRTESVPLGRGGLRYSTWDLEQAKDLPPFKTPVSADENWERITYFLERVIPVAAEYKIRMACHPCDPWLPPGYRGVDRVLGGFEGFKRLIEICPSPYHGLNLCLGCMAESVEDPAGEVPEIIRYFGQRKKIFLVHYRNIIGKRNKFQEVFQDNGVMNMHKIMQVMKEIEYPYMFVEDHEPSHPDDPGGRQSAAFQWGYMTAMLQAVQDEG